ncbi:MAG: hypothetical protein ACRENX_03070 [Candidatus Dormibacteria bacterium]
MSERRLRLQPLADPKDDPRWELPIPFLGDRADRNLVFLGVNPSYFKGQRDHRLGDTFEAWDGWARHYFTAAPKPWATLYQGYQQIGEAAFGSDFKAGRRYRPGVHPLPQCRG